MAKRGVLRTMCAAIWPPLKPCLKQARLRLQRAKAKVCRAQGRVRGVFISGQC